MRLVRVLVLAKVGMGHDVVLKGKVIIDCLIFLALGVEVFKVSFSTFVSSCQFDGHTLCVVEDREVLLPLDAELDKGRR